VGLQERAHTPYKTYSLGMKQRLGLASTLLTDPEIVILDEPTNGLDPAGQREIRALIPRLAREGRAVLLASHLLHEVEQVCERVAIIRRGRLLRTGSVAELVRGSAYLDIEIADPAAAAEALRPLPFVDSVTLNGRRLQVETAADRSPEINRALAERGLYAAEIVRRQGTLEDIFLELTESPEGAGEKPERRSADARHVA
jgi:ABC-2 type transport system ATP-binding protein